jgi:hypothetical protein
MKTSTSASAKGDTMKQVTGYPVIDEILESLRPQASTISAHELELDGLAFELAYQAIRHSGLYAQLENEQWDALAEKFKVSVRAHLEGLIDNELTRIEQEQPNASHNDR